MSLIVNLGTKTGKMLLFGGVYSNLQALEALITVAEAEVIPPENCICTGDIVGYCAQPEETVQRFKQWGAGSIAGNVELQLVAGEADCGCDFEVGGRCDTFSRRWFPYANDQLSPDSRAWMATLPHYMRFTYAHRTIGVVHGAFGNVSQYIFKSTPLAVKESQFKDLACDLIIAGHCGLPFYEKLVNGIWLNPGVIGMPGNDGTPRVWYAILDEVSEGLQFQIRPLDYDYKTASKRMIDRALPKAYAHTLVSGLWDNMEILPAPERRLQGVAISSFETL
ncbi:MAG: metallophosphoesterase family protein [Bacteroidota bacterium]